MGCTIDATFDTAQFDNSCFNTTGLAIGSVPSTKQTVSHSETNKSTVSTDSTYDSTTSKDDTYSSTITISE